MTQTYSTVAPSLTHFATVPDMPNSASSGWANTARTRLPAIDPSFAISA